MAQMNREGPVIVFEFADERTARNAMETFEELGYDPEWHDSESPQTRVGIRVVSEDLTSALEIGQAYGGTLLTSAHAKVHVAQEEEEVYKMAYDLDQETDSEMATAEPGAASAGRDRLDATGPEPEIPGSDEGPLYDVSADTYDHFSGDVRA
jgi:hypothetical protein